jgi:hypothetical protein
MKNTNNISSLEALLETILVEYLQVNTVPSGRMVGGPEIVNKDTSKIYVTPLCHYENGCPLNLSEFIKTATSRGTKKLTRDEAFQWWARTRLRYCCSTLCCSFIKVLVPFLHQHGIFQLPSLTLGQKDVRLENLEMLSVAFLPPTTHQIVLKYPVLIPMRTESVEPLQGNPPHCSHNVLRCRQTGIVVDMALGQFLGTVQPYIFSSMDDFIQHVPGKVMAYDKTSERDIQMTYDRDDAAHRKRISPDAAPVPFIRRVCWRPIKQRRCSVGIVKESPLLVSS